MIISGQTPDVRARLLESLNKGPKLVNYAGHGSVDLWRGNIFTSADALSLTSSGKVSVYLIMTCLNGYYHAPNIDSLAESLLKAPGGAAAVWASSGFTVPTDQENLDTEMVKTIYERRGITLGRAIHIAKTAIARKKSPSGSQRRTVDWDGTAERTRVKLEKRTAYFRLRRCRRK